MRALALLGLLSVAPSQEVGGEAAPRPAWHHFTLARGVRLSVLHVPDAVTQATFAVLPGGLCGDAPGRAQFAHLAEHMMIRAVDPDGLSVDGMELNGETSALALRLDTSVPAERWREGLMRLFQWLQARAFEPAVLRREQRTIAAEEATTMAGGNGHKWAAAAWYQVVAHGADHAAVHGDVAGANAEQVAEDIAARARVDGRLVLLSAGPAEAAALREAAAAAIVSLPPDPPQEATAAPPASVVPRGELHRTWDLPGRHLIDDYPLPGDAPADRAAAEVLAMLLTQRAFAHRGLRDLGARVLVSADHTAIGRPHLVLSASLPDEADVAAARAALREIVDGVAPASRSARFLVAGMLARTRAPRDLAGLRAQTPEWTRRWVEANLALDAFGLAQRIGVALEDVGSVLRRVDADAVEALVEATLRPELRRSLLLVPR